MRYLDRDLAVGDRVGIYGDPITRQDYEGMATIKAIESQRLGVCVAVVAFLDSPYGLRRKLVAPYEVSD